VLWANVHLEHRVPRLGPGHHDPDELGNGRRLCLAGDDRPEVVERLHERSTLHEAAGTKTRPLREACRAYVAVK
jgi:hypothetical protein